MTKLTNRQAIGVLDGLWSNPLFGETHRQAFEIGIKAIKALEQEPSINSQPKTGHWIREIIRNEKGGCIGAKMICSECGNDNKHDEYMNYCPNCGKKMDERREVRYKV